MSISSNTLTLSAANGMANGILLQLSSNNASITSNTINRSGSGSLSIGGATAGDHHVSAAFVAGALLLLVLLYKGRFRFSTKVG